MILTLELDLERVKVDQHTRYLGYGSFISKVIVQLTHRHTHRTNCSRWTTNVDTHKITRYPFGVKSVLLFNYSLFSFNHRFSTVTVDQTG